jgi:UDP-N-acetylmuramyl tripeptide synthase
MCSAKLIAVSDKSGHTISVLKKLFTLCGRTNCRVAPAGEPLRPCEQPAVFLCCTAGSDGQDQGFAVSVAEYGVAGQAGLTASAPMTYSVRSDKADFTARDIRRTPEGRIAFEIVGVGVIGRVRLLTGREDRAEPSLAAAAAAIAAGVPFAEVLDALNKMEFDGEEEEPAALL